MLRHLVKIAHRLVDLGNACTLLGGCGRDFANHVGHALNRLHDVGHGGAGIRHQPRAGVHLFHRRIDQLLDLLGGLGTALGQAAHFAGHHRKTSSLLTSTGCLDGRVQRQDVGLKCNAINDTNDVGDLFAALIDLVHGGNHLRYHLTAASCHASGTDRQAAGLLGTASALLDGAGELLHGGCGLLQVARCLLGARGKIVVAGGNFGTGDGNAVGALAHLVHHAAQGIAHRVLRSQQITKLVATRDGGLHAQVARCNAGSEVVGLGQGLLNAANEEIGPANDRQQQGAHRHRRHFHGQHA